MMSRPGSRIWMVITIVVAIAAAVTLWYAAKGVSPSVKATESESPQPANSPLPSRVVMDGHGLIRAVPDMTGAVGSAILSGLVRPTDQQWRDSCRPMSIGENTEDCTAAHQTRAVPRFIEANLEVFPSVAASESALASQRKHLPVYALGARAGADENVPHLGDEAFSVRYSDSGDMYLLPLDWWYGGAQLIARYKNVVLGVTSLGPAHTVDHTNGRNPPVPTASYAQDRQEAIAVMRLLIARLS